MSVRTVIKSLIPTKLFHRVEPFGHLTEAVIFNAINGFPTRNLKVIGVTGTNGKTTTCFMIHRMLQEAGYNTGLMSTVAYGVGEDIKPQIHHMTSVAVPEFLSRIKAMKKLNMDYLVLETTSHALAQNRVWGVPYSVSVFTNLTHEHISYHGSFEAYRKAKVKLFKMTNANKKGLRTGIVNAEDPNSKYFADEVETCVSYGIKEGDLKASKIRLDPTGSEYTVKGKNDEYHIKCSIPGTFNVYNSLAAVCVGETLGLSKEQIEKGIAGLQSVEGRMTSINEGQNFDVIVDYAHSPDSFEKLFKDIRPLVKGRMIVLFGSLGGGDKEKRPLQGELAGKYADIVVICEEDDRKEDPKQITEDIAKGARKAGKKEERDLVLIHDRPEAIRYAVNMAREGDTVLLLGKGHEKTIEHADGEHPWNEIEEAKQAIRERLNSR